MNAKTIDAGAARSQAERRASDRRAHRRIALSELPKSALIRIPNRPAVSLVDVSSGGALLELPFQMRPESRFTLELSTPEDRLAVPFQLLRCYVADLKGGVRYHAAGAFDQIVKLPASLAGGLELSALDRLISTLEAFLRTRQATEPDARDARFNELLRWVVAALQRGEASHLISRQIKTHLVRLFPSLAISRSTPSIIGDVLTSARFFGFDFRTNRVLTAPDRRFLRASAQLINLIERSEGAETEPTQAPTILEAPSSLIVHSIAEWQAIQNAS
jgi:hypothetical protein